MLADGVLPVPSRADVRADLKSLADDFSRLFATDCECYLRTDRRYWPSRFVGPNEAILPKCFRRNDADDWEHHLSGDGLQADPIPVRSSEDAARAQMFYGRDGLPVVSSTGQLMIMAPGWDSDHEIKLRGPGTLRTAETIERANDLAFDVGGLLGAILWPGRSLRFRAFSWPDVVDAVADLATRSTLKSADWHVTAGRQSYSVDVWRRRADFEFGVPMVPDEIADRIGDDPEHVWAVRRAFLRDSEAAARWLIGQLTEAPEPVVEPVVEPVGEPVGEPVVEPVGELTAEAMADVTADPVGDAIEADDPGEPACSLNTGGRVLVWAGKRYSLPKNGFAVVKILFDAWEKGHPEVSLESIRNAVDSSALDESLAKVFQRRKGDNKFTDPVWDVIETVSQGVYRLADPKKS